MRRAESLTPRLRRVTLAGPDLVGFTVAEPAASVRLLVPWPGEAVELPTWTGNEFLLADGRRPAIRTFTPVRADPVAGELDLEIVVHGAGVTSTWAAHAEPGRPAAVSGPGRGYTVEVEAPAFFLAGDETALPAIRQLLRALPTDRPRQVHVEIAAPEARLSAATAVQWHELPAGAAPGDALVAAVRVADIPADARLWVAGEAAAVQRIRRHLFEERGIPRQHAIVRGYWKHGRAGAADE